MLETAQQILREGKRLVLATSREDQPHCSLMAYVTDEDARRIYMLTNSGSRKFENMLANPKVSLLVDTRSQKKSSQPIRSLTVTGLVILIEDKENKKQIIQRIITRHPNLAELAVQPMLEVVCVEAKAFLLLDGVTQSHYFQL